ncbi:putative capsular polysaccharide synthesis family protein [Oceanihabitans sp. 2_MG-2023]|uniref:putative capsular polysaccharide synthesis family protein n=1 Tax=Oceanihabitans sp. 2_MG-2023 TaxID=3062661 RepID=UPI0026E45E1D|nr:putative capsular polysaccharide synthesis family protein [Oceanihabitans sp. 2_MG-2023]MDO6597683.1 putative capsular polysaccharide synthesis family protein [Oceanihabitans sp. 2_MG-2023]
MKNPTSFLKKALKKPYHFVRKQYYTKLGLDKDLILVYTLSKVGSSSVYYSLKKKFPYKEIHHVHFLGDTWLNKLKNDHEIFQNNIKTANRLFKLFKKKQWNIKIISLTRDPIARDISGIFQAWQHIFNVDDITKVSAESILDYLNNNDFSYSENWFETDFLEFTGCNVFEETFNTETGFQTYTSNNIPILILQLEQLNTVYNEAMNVFLGKDNYVLHQENITSSRASGALNKKIKSALSIPDKKLDTIYTSKYMKTFYNASQIKAFKKRWTKQ